MVCDNLFKVIDSLEEKYTKVLVDVCNIESPTDYKKGVDAVIGKAFGINCILH